VEANNISDFVPNNRCTAQSKREIYKALNGSSLVWYLVLTTNSGNFFRFKLAFVENL